MDLDPGQLRALSVAVAEGSLEGAARVLHVTPSAVSQRLRALEAATGRVLLVRSRPVRVTAAGEVVLRLARQVEQLTAEAAAGLGVAEPGRVPRVAVAVNADSLATWVLPALAPLAAEVSLELHRADQERTAALLRDGSVVGAVTAEAAPVPGCRTVALGAMRYRAVATRAVLARWFPDGPTPAALARAPVVVFDRDDDLQHAFLRRHGAGAAAPPTHRVPSSADFVDAVRLGWGWGMVPDLQAGDDLDRGRLVELVPGDAADVVLHWQRWRDGGAALDRVTEALTTSAAAALVRGGPAGR
ncbi:LysR family transcriptional regulator ArgP [Rhodococcus aerolatus]